MSILTSCALPTTTLLSAHVEAGEQRGVHAAHPHRLADGLGGDLLDIGRIGGQRRELDHGHAQHDHHDHAAAAILPGPKAPRRDSCCMRSISALRRSSSSCSLRRRASSSSRARCSASRRSRSRFLRSSSACFLRSSCSLARRSFSSCARRPLPRAPLLGFLARLLSGQRQLARFAVGALARLALGSVHGSARLFLHAEAALLLLQRLADGLFLGQNSFSTSARLA